MSGCFRPLLCLLWTGCILLLTPYYLPDHRPPIMFGLRAWPTPVVKPLWPFAIASVLTLYGVSKLQGAALQTEDAKNDPRNPYISSQAKAKAAH